MLEDLSNENVVHVCKDGIEYLQFRKLLEYPEVEHCYTMSRDSMSFKIFEDDSILQESYQKICNPLQWNKNYIVKPHQTHTDRVEFVDNSMQIFDEVDGVITNKKNIILCTTSADCTSLLLYDPVKKVIGDIHSGWRGTLNKIGQKAVLKMIKEYGCNPKDIICCICPHIRKCHFEVEKDVMKMFQNEFSYIEKQNGFIKQGKIVDGVQKYYIDTTTINIKMLEEIGLKEENIIDSGICTVCQKEYFHSYRVDKEKSGRNAAMITLK